MWKPSENILLTGLHLLLLATSDVAADPEFPNRGAQVSWLRAAYSRPPAEWPEPTLDEGVVHRELGTPGPVPFPEGMEPTKEKKKLGLSLFFDPRLSGSQQISCSRCHDPEKGWSDGRSLATGVFMTPLARNTPGLHGIGHAKSMFWDGRAATLEEQARAVILNPKEMAGNPEEIVRRLEVEKEFYHPKFKAAFGEETITFDRIVQAIAAFERGITAGRGDFDKFLAGKSAALDDSALAGLHLFRTRARCINCHNGPVLTDDRFHNAGLTYYGRSLQDTGVFARTGKPEDMGRFRTPSLRNVGKTGPWMHNGVFPDLRGVLNMYNAGMPRPKPREDQKNDPLFPQTSPLLKPLDLDATELADLEAFLRSLDEPATRILKPPFPPVVTP